MAQTKMTAAQVLDKVANALSNNGSTTLDMVIQNGGQSLNAQLVMSRNMFTYRFGTLYVLFDGKTQWTIDYDSQEISITEPTAEELAEVNPLAFVQNYKKNFNVSLVSQNGGTYTIKMTALRKSSYIRSAQVVISAETWMPTHVTALLSTGQTLTIRIFSPVKGKPLAPSSFKFNAKDFEGYEIIDLK